MGVVSDLQESRFLADVKDHKISIVRDDGVYRHVRFAKPETVCMHFDLITWPGYLAYVGDMGAFTFTRLRDMFEFFRGDHKPNLGDLEALVEEIQEELRVT